MRHIGPAGGYGLSTQGAEAVLILPKLPESRRVRRGKGLAHRPSGTGQPRRAQAASTVLRNRQAMVMGPTPPGTGVM